jgi:hypothetical protein
MFENKFQKTDCSQCPPITGCSGPCGHIPGCNPLCNCNANCWSSDPADYLLNHINLQSEIRMPDPYGASYVTSGVVLQNASLKTYTPASN